MLALLAPASATADGGRFFSLLPVGQGTQASLADFAQSTLTGGPPAPFVNQRDMFNALPSAALADGDLSKYFKVASLDPPAAPASVVMPRAGVTIARDAFNVPYVTGVTRADTMFGAGYAEAEDRLFFMDVLRHTAVGRSTELIGPGVDEVNVRTDAAQLSYTDYTDADLQAMIDRGAASSPQGKQVAEDLKAYTDGINARIAEVRNDVTKLPAEYSLLGKPLNDWRTIDSVAILGLLNGYYGLGGGGDLAAAEAFGLAVKRFGARRGRGVYEDFRRREDPEAPTVVTRRFPFDDPGRADAKAIAMPDAGSVRTDDYVRTRTGSAALSGVLDRGLQLKHHASNAMVINGSRAVGGHPILVAGPQVGFYAPSILDEIVLRGPGIAVRGAAVPGAGTYPIAGRGPSYAWSVTTAQGDNTDIFAERLCAPDGGQVAADAMSYMRHGRCIPFTVQRRTLSWQPGAADLAAGTVPSPYSATLEIARSVHGPVIARGTVKGAPVAFTRGRASYRNEVPAALGLSLLASGAVSGPREFQRDIAQASGSYNWFYADAKHASYVQSGLYPVRAKGTSPDFPTWGDGAHDWRGFDPATGTSKALGFRRLPQAIDPARGYLISWNQKQAPGWRSSDADWEYGSVHRSQRLEVRVQRALRTGDRKVGLGELAAIMGDAGTVDNRGQEVLPWLLRVIGTTPRADVADAVARLRSWAAAGAHRRDADGDGFYDQSAAVAVMDAWWPKLLQAIYRPVLGDALYDRLTAINHITELPAEGPDTFYYGWDSYVDKDLRTLLGKKVRGRFSRRYCGNGRLAACRSQLTASLAEAVRAVGALDGVKVATTCEDTGGFPQKCDQLQFTAAGATTVAPVPWQDRGSFQQVVQVGG